MICVDKIRLIVNNLRRLAEVAELADARDSKSRPVYPGCGFDSHLRQFFRDASCVYRIAQKRHKSLTAESIEKNKNVKKRRWIPAFAGMTIFRRNDNATDHLATKGESWRSWFTMASIFWMV